MQQQEAHEARKLGMVKVLGKILPLQIDWGKPVKRVTHPEFSLGRVLHDASPRPVQGSRSRSLSRVKAGCSERARRAAWTH
ncbi:hypothetical protein, partial [Streptomyces sp. CYG21]|uniref:hypothetical protein n=1 Tax=Streptomyces sp. CYG21 TaxID=2838874 RepID=UPI001EFE481B